MDSSAAIENAYLSVQNLTKRFGSNAAVDNISLDIPKGEIFALLGSSGCGKSTLLRMLAGFETPTEGQVILEGRDITRLPPFVRPINMMFQSYALFPHLSVFENIAFGLRREGKDEPFIKHRVGEMLELTQMSSFAARKPHQLSGGQQQRVALARSLAKSPQLLLLDEPLGALDKKLRERTQVELVNIIRQVGVTCVMVTHDQEEAMTMAQRIAVMSEGKFLQVGSPNDIYETPATRFVADFIGSVNLFEGTVTVDMPDRVHVECAECVHYVGHGITGVQGMVVAVAVRPEKMTLSTVAPKKTEFNCVQGVVQNLSYFGSHTVYRIALLTGMVIKAMIENERRHVDGFAAGSTVWVSWPDDAQIVLTQ